jgi:hypothetical protein
MSPGDVVVEDGGQPVPGVSVEPNRGDDGLIITGPDFAMDLQGIDRAGAPVPLDPDGVLVLQRDRTLRTSGTGFFPNSYVILTLNPPQSGASVMGRLLARATPGIHLGRVLTNSDGSFDDTLVLDRSIGVGDHVVQAVGVTHSNAERAISLGVRVQDPATRPGPVRNLRVVKATPGTVSMRWIAPADDGGDVITGYKVRYRLWRDDRYTGRDVVPATRATLIGLQPGAVYYIRVKAVNGQGTGPSDSFIRIRVPRR